MARLCEKIKIGLFTSQDTQVLMPCCQPGCDFSLGMLPWHLEKITLPPIGFRVKCIWSHLADPGLGQCYPVSKSQAAHLVSAQCLVRTEHSHGNTPAGSLWCLSHVLILTGSTPLLSTMPEGEVSPVQEAAPAEQTLAGSSGTQLEPHTKQPLTLWACH